MHDFENDLKKAASAYIDKAFGTEERAETSSSLEDRVGKLLSRDAHGETVRGKESSFMKRPRKWTALIAAAALVALLGAAVAAGPIIRNFINTRTAQESVVQLDEVPEGWIGVWTVEDLDAVRDDLEASYILMEDLAFTPEDFEDGGRFAGGWKPIGTEKSPFIGTFNGNGHVIHGLYITNEKDSAVEETKNYVGLFGYCRLWTGWDIQYDLDPEYAAVNGFKFFEEVGSGDFVMKNSADESKTILYDVIGYDDMDGTDIPEYSFIDSSYFTDVKGHSVRLRIEIVDEEWHKAPAGSYSDVLTFLVSYITDPDTEPPEEENNTSEN